MYRLLIVDDEEHTREGLRRLALWKEAGVDGIRVAGSGAEALDMARAFLPDIMVTDVKMPGMDGLELSRRLRESLPAIKIVIISGYDDAAYLKNAIKISACDYIMKPVDLAELRECVMRATAQIDGERARQNTAQSLIDKYRRGERFLQDAFVRLLLSGEKSEIAHLREAAPEMDLFQSVDVFRAGVARADQDCPESRDKILGSLREAGQLAFSTGRGGLCAFLLTGDAALRADASVALVRGALDACGVRACAGLGAPVTDVFQAHESLVEAGNALESLFASDGGTVRVWDDACAAAVCAETKRVSVPGLERAFALDKRAFGDWKREFVGDVRAQARMGRARVLRYLTNVVSAVDAILAKSFAIEPEDDMYLERVTADLNSRYRLRGMLACMENYLTLAYDLINARADDDTRLCVTRTMEYIGSNYFENLTIAELARRVYRAPTYLCLLFRQHTGGTIGAYITMVRMEKAKELLRDMDLKLYDIARMVGYSNPGYFAGQFKKYTGLMPSKYRERGL